MISARTSRYVRLRRALTALLVAALAALAGVLATPGQAGATVTMPKAASANPTNPLAGRPWGIWRNSRDDVWPAYQAARGVDRDLLGKIALQPRTHWFGAYNPDDQIEQIIHDYIADVTGGDPNVLAQLAVFRVDPWETCQQLPSKAQQASYRRWIDNAARGIGDAHVALILQPDLPFALCAPHHSQLQLRMVSYASRVFSALPHTSVYIDVGAADWESEAEAVQLLLAADVADARGFALNLTHYDSTARQISFGAQIVSSLAHHGVPHRHFVINTAENGRPFKFLQYYGTRDRAQRPVPCTATRRTLCATLGIPPTSDVANPRWNLPAWAARAAAKLVDGYLWMGRPWLNISPFSLNVPYALALARSTPF